MSYVGMSGVNAKGAASGAIGGATAGTAVVPGIGTVVGGVIGAFGGGMTGGDEGMSTSDLLKLAAVQNKANRLLARKSSKTQIKVATTYARQAPAVALAVMVGVVAIGIAVASRSK